MKWDEGKYACCHGQHSVFSASVCYNGKEGGYVVTVLGRRLKKAFGSMDEGRAAATAALRKACVDFLKEHHETDKEEA
jgi:hypothetical protein